MNEQKKQEYEIFLNKDIDVKCAICSNIVLFKYKNYKGNEICKNCGYEYFHNDILLRKQFLWDWFNRIIDKIEVEQKIKDKIIKEISNEMEVKNVDIDDLYKQILVMKKWIKYVIGNPKNEQTLRMNWRELQYRNKLTKLLNVSPIASWDVIYNAIKHKLSSTNS